jgi:hypothetical protein
MLQRRENDEGAVCLFGDSRAGADHASLTSAAGWAFSL